MPLAPPKTGATLADWLRHAEKLYARHEVALGQVAVSAHDEALYLLLHTLGLPLDSRPTVLRRKLTAAEGEKVAEIFRRRLEEHVPAAYLTREAWLGPHRFYVDERVIIPRSYFLEIIPEQLPAWLPPDRPVRRVIDVCTGSGCLAVLLAHQFPAAKVDAIELSPDALAVARFNVAMHGLTRRIKLHHSDVFDAVPPVKYDVILSNPPYVPTRELRELPAGIQERAGPGLGWRQGRARHHPKKFSARPAPACKRTGSLCSRSGACARRWTGPSPRSTCTGCTPRMARIACVWCTRRG